MKIYETLISELKNEPNFVSDENDFKKWVVIDKARIYDKELLEILLKNDELKNEFFVKVDNVFVFKQDYFIQFLEAKKYLDDSYTKFKNKIGLTINNKFLNQQNDVSLIWPYKDCVLEGGASRDEMKKDEIFFNEILARDEITQLFDSKVLTNYNCYGATPPPKI